MRWPWSKQQQKYSDHEVTTWARLQATEIMINTIFEVLRPDQQGQVKEVLRRFVGTVSTITAPPSFQPHQVQLFHDLLSVVLQAPMMLRPDQQDIAVGIDKLVERIKEATKAAAEADQGKR